MDDDAVRARLAELKPDIVGATAITPSIYKAERVLEIAKEVHPGALTDPGRRPCHLHVPAGADRGALDRRDRARRGRGDPDRAGPRDRRRAAGPSSAPRSRASPSATATKIVATPAAPTVKDLDAIEPDWGMLEWEKYNYIPLNVRVAIPNMARGCPFTCSFCSQWKFWRDYRDPRSRRRWSTRSRSWSTSTTSGSSSSPTRNRPSTARSSSSSARS